VEKTQLYSKQDKLFPYTAILPSVVLVIFIGLIPTIYTLILSFQRYELVEPPPSYIGLTNYTMLCLRDARFLHALIFTVLFAIVATFLELVIGFFIAYLLADKEISKSYSALIRTVIMVPFVVAPVVVSYSFKTLIYDQTFGYLNYFFKFFSIPPFDLFKGYLNAPIGILIMEVILRTPFIVIVLYAGISSINTTIYDAAEIDGVSWYQKIARIVVPTITPIIIVASVLRFMDVLKMFDEIYVLTAGGPGTITENISLFAVNQAFYYFHIGYAAASAFILLVLIIIILSLFMRAFRL